MKDKRFTYLLIALMLGVWAFVGTRVFRSFNGTEINAPIATTTLVPLEQDQTVDEYKLDLSYKDPFGNYTYRATPSYVPPTNGVNATIPKQLTPKSPQPVAKIAMPSLSYHGIIMNLDNGNAIGVMYVNGVEYLIQKNQKIDGVVIQTIDEERVTVLFNNALQEIKII